jgi:phosphotriesterase-related protein
MTPGPRVVRTVLGDIPPEQLGITAAHEHLWCDQHLCRVPKFPRKAELMQLLDLDLVVRELDAFRQHGGRAVIEMTLNGWGRDVGRLAEIARRTGLHVVAVAGYYVEACLPGFVFLSDAGALEDAILRELTEGADGTAIRPGLLKASVSRPVIEGEEERCARAVARVARRTGLAITTHTSGSIRFQIRGGNAGTALLDLFESEGVDPARVIIGHCDENADLRQLCALADRGATVQFDVIGKAHWLLDETRADLVVALLERGHGDRLMLSSDRNRVSELTVRGGPGYGHVLGSFVPRLRARGVDAGTLDRILVGNPARIFSIDPGRVH